MFIVRQQRNVSLYDLEHTNTRTLARTCMRARTYAHTHTRKQAQTDIRPEFTDTNLELIEDAADMEIRRNIS